TYSVPLAPALRQSYRVGGARDDRPAAWQFSTDIEQRQRQGYRLPVDVHYNFIREELGDAIPCAAAQRVGTFDPQTRPF
ncbi:MAG: hypothetical protein DMD58_05650, partial [Gemmatimonadetes bacterium]